MHKVYILSCPVVVEAKSFAAHVQKSFKFNKTNQNEEIEMSELRMTTMAALAREGVGGGGREGGGLGGGEGGWRGGA